VHQTQEKRPSLPGPEVPLPSSWGGKGEGGEGRECISFGVRRRGNLGSPSRVRGLYRRVCCRKGERKKGTENALHGTVQMFVQFKKLKKGGTRFAAAEGKKEEGVRRAWRGASFCVATSGVKYLVVVVEGGGEERKKKGWGDF